jgi:hypothetical protein
MFSVVTVRDVQPEIRPEVTRKMRKSFENRGLMDVTDWGDMRNSDEITFDVNESSFPLVAETSRLAALRSLER